MNGVSYVSIHNTILITQKNFVFLLFLLKNPSANNSGFIYSFDKLKMKEIYEAML